MLFDLTVPQFTKMLRNLNKILDKAAKSAEERKFDVDVLLQSRLAPDQFHFTRQIQIACDTAKLCASRLTTREVPVNEDKEKSLIELSARIAQTVDYLSGFTAKDFTGAESRRITQPRWEGKWLSGHDYVVQHALPNFYFHFTTAYAILRHNGVDVGKKDYLGELPYQK